MAGEDPESEQRTQKFYNVESIVRHFRAPGKTRSGPISWIIRQIVGRLDSVQGLMMLVGWSGIMIGSFFLVALGIAYGVVPFLVTMAALLLGLSFIIERRVGRSLQFEEYKVLKRALAQGLAFAIFVGILFVLLWANGKI